MTDIFNNAVTSIVLGVEDFREGSDARMLSAARNYFAGLLLLGKECLLRAAPDADPMEVIGARFEPVPDGDGGVDHKWVGYATVDLAQLQKRFKNFQISWPKVDIDQLQNLRNKLEHYHLDAPTKTLREAIASSFPMVIDFMALLNEDPKEVLADVFDTILEERDSFIKLKAICDQSVNKVDWPAEIKHLDQLSCSSCGSSLIRQIDGDNTNALKAEAECYQCGHAYEPHELAEMVVLADYGIDQFIAAQEGDVSPIFQCPICLAEAYVVSGEVNACYACNTKVGGYCEICGTSIGLLEYHPDHPRLCGYHANRYEKVMRE